MERAERNPSCLICRRRKIKCDRTPGACHRCRKLGEQCIYSAESTRLSAPDSANRVAPTTQAGLKRRRITLSCEECKKAKVKCSGGTKCDRCKIKRHGCIYRTRQQRVSSSLRQPPPMPLWLTGESLPTEDRIRQLIDIYFARIHSVRCLGFLHPPTFTKNVLDKLSQKLEPPISGLVAIMCALAAPFYYARIAIAAGEEEEEDLDPNIQFFNAGRGWVGTALKAVFLAGSIQGTETLMTQILLHDYYLRVGDYAQAFLVSGMVARHFQLLQFSLEYDTDITCRTSKMKASAKETRRRVGWACYLLDALIECGVDQLRFVSATDIQVQLPCSEELFVRNIPVPTETLPQGQVLPFVNKQSFLADSATANLDLRAYYIRAVVIRSKILRYVKHLQREIPWEDTSQFAQLRNELQALEGSIPDHYKMSPENTCLLKMAGRLNLYFGLHILLAQTYNDLYRVGISRLVFPHSATKWIRENAPGEFLHLCHRMCLTKAVAIASWLQDLWRCDKESLIDLPYAVHAQICSSVLVTTLISWRRFAAEPVLPWLSLDDYRSMLQSNIQILGFLKRYFKAELFHESAAQALKQFNRVNGTPSLNPMANALIRSNVAAPASQTAQSGALEYILNPLGTYPMARTQILDPHQTKAIHGEDSPQSDVEPPAPSSTGPVETIEERLIAENTAIMADNNVLGPMRCELLNWEDELQLMMGMGYPTFMDDSSTQWNYDY